MSALTLQAAARIMHEAVLDRTYEGTGLGPHIQRYLNWKRLSQASERTLDQYERDLARMAVTLAHLTIRQVAAPDLLLVFDKFPQGSWRRARAAMSGFWIYLLKMGEIDRNPMDMLPDMRPEPGKIYDIFEGGEQAAIIKAQDVSPLPERDTLGVLVFQELGVRKSEALALQVSSFDLRTRHVIIRKGSKGRKQRAVPFTDELYIALMDFLNTPIPRVRTRQEDRWAYEDRLPAPDDYLFFPAGRSEVSLLWTDPSKPMGQTSMHRWWQRAIKRSGVKYRSLHMTRHTVGTDLVDADVDLISVQEWLGHANVSTTQAYVHNSRRRLQGAAEKARVYRQKTYSARDDRDPA